MVEAPKIRRATKSDKTAIVDLLARQKRLNEEFDTHFRVSDQLEKRIDEYLERVIADHDGYIVLVGEDDGKVVAVVSAFLRDRLFYEPRIEVRITDFYIHPEYRRRGLGKALTNQLIKESAIKGTDLITVEFPSLNMIARNFSESLSFKEIISIMRIDDRS